MDSLTEIYNEMRNEEHEVLPPPRRKIKISKARTYIQLITEPYESCFRWTNESVLKDRQLLYFKANMVAKRISDTKLRILLDWAKGKNLHVKQFIKTINKVLREKNL